MEQQTNQPQNITKVWWPFATLRCRRFNKKKLREDICRKTRSINVHLHWFNYFLIFSSFSYFWSFHYYFLRAVRGLTGKAFQRARFRWVLFGMKINWKIFGILIKLLKRLLHFRWGVRVCIICIYIKYVLNGWFAWIDVNLTSPLGTFNTESTVFLNAWMKLAEKLYSSKFLLVKRTVRVFENCSDN